MPPKPAGQGVQKPLYLGLGESLAVVERIQRDGGGSLRHETLSPVLKNTPKSSSFRLKLNALKSYGLVSEDRDRVELTELGMKYVAPTTEYERLEAAVQAFRNVELLRTLHDRYGGGMLPGRDILANVLLREYGAKEPLNGQWAEFFLDSARSAELVGSAGGRTVLRRGPEEGAARFPPAGTPLSTTAVDASPRSADPVVERVRVREPEIPSAKDVQRVEFPLQDGSAAAILLPRAATPEDIADVIDMLQIMKKRAERMRDAQP